MKIFNVVCLGTGKDVDQITNESDEPLLASEQQTAVEEQRQNDDEVTQDNGLYFIMVYLYTSIPIVSNKQEEINKEIPTP